MLSVNEKAVVHNSDSCAGSKLSGCWGSAASGCGSVLALASADDNLLQWERRHSLIVNKGPAEAALGGVAVLIAVLFTVSLAVIIYATYFCIDFS